LTDGIVALIKYDACNVSFAQVAAGTGIEVSNEEYEEIRHHHGVVRG
jgi:hypothetical protein